MIAFAGGAARKGERTRLNAIYLRVSPCLSGLITSPS